MTAVLFSIAFLSGAACALALTLAFTRYADVVDADSNARRPRNFTQGADRDEADRQGGVQSFTHKQGL